MRQLSTIMRPVPLLMTLMLGTGHSAAATTAQLATRARTDVAEMTLAEKIQTVFGYFSTDYKGTKRLGGWDKLTLAAGAAGETRIEIDPRTLAVFDSARGRWNIAAGEYEVILAEAADAPVATVKVRLPARGFAAGAR